MVGVAHEEDRVEHADPGPQRLRQNGRALGRVPPSAPQLEGNHDTRPALQQGQRALHGRPDLVEPAVHVAHRRPAPQDPGGASPVSPPPAGGGSRARSSPTAFSAFIWRCVTFSSARTSASSSAGSTAKTRLKRLARAAVQAPGAAPRSTAAALPPGRSPRMSRASSSFDCALDGPWDSFATSHGWTYSDAAEWTPTRYRAASPVMSTSRSASRGSADTTAE